MIELLKEFDQLMVDITTMDMKVKVGNGEYKEATPTDRLEFIRNEWFNLLDKLENGNYE